jgi:tRNA(fMet)-specific endonuclease VapC
VRYFIDANLIRYIARRQAGWENIVKQWIRVGRHNCYFSAVIFYELMVAADNHRLTKEERQDIAALAADFVTLDFDVIAAVHSARVKTEKNRRGTPSQKDAVDTMLAGHALALGATVATHNLKHFEGVPGLAVENWLIPHAG